MSETLIYTVHEVAKILHSSPNYIYKLIEYGYLPAIKLGSIKILKSSIQNLSQHLKLRYKLLIFFRLEKKKLITKKQNIIKFFHLIHHTN